MLLAQFRKKLQTNFLNTIEVIIVMSQHTYNCSKISQIFAYCLMFCIAMPATIFFIESEIEKL